MQAGRHAQAGPGREAAQGQQGAIARRSPHAGELLQAPQVVGPGINLGEYRLAAKLRLHVKLPQGMGAALRPPVGIHVRQSLQQQAAMGLVSGGRAQASKLACW